MEIIRLLNSVNSVNDYISITQMITETCRYTKVQLNIETILALKKVRALEIEYLDKCHENGAACILFENLLSLPPSKTWRILAKELVSLLQYWLEAIRKYLISHNLYWWSFLKLILKFIKNILHKDASIPDILVELTAECLFDIATRETTDVYQQHDILHGLNAYCAQSSKEIRYALSDKFKEYFTKLASSLARCGYLPCQYVSLEALMRWLVKRQDPNCRAAAAQTWFPPDLYPAAAIDVFLKSTWTNFYQDSRQFVNAVNESNGLVTSVICKRINIGNITIISGAEREETWLDINRVEKCMSILLNPRVLVRFGLLDQTACETLLISQDITEIVQLYRESQEVKMTVRCHLPLHVYPSGIALGEECDVTLVFSSRAHLTKLDAAMKLLFENKYLLQINLEDELTLSPPRARDTRTRPNSSKKGLNRQPDNKVIKKFHTSRKKKPGSHIQPKENGGCTKKLNAEVVTPSSASTTSLAQLHEKLEALPKYRYDKELVSVCAEPQLSNVTEIKEEDDKSIQSVSTLKCDFTKNTDIRSPSEQLAEVTKKKASSDSEKSKLKTKSRRQYLSQVPTSPTSCLLEATIESTNVDTLERLGKNNYLEDGCIVDLLVQEALGLKPPVVEAATIDNGKNCCDKNCQENEVNSEPIENTPIQDDIPYQNRKIVRKKICTVISKSTTDDESNTEAINETPTVVSARKNRFKRIPTAKGPVEPNAVDKSEYDDQSVKKSFSQSFAQTKSKEIVTSPSLAKETNESSSDTSKSFDKNDLMINKLMNANKEFDDIDIVECLNDMVVKVCRNFEKCTEYLNINNVAGLHSQTILTESNTNGGLHRPLSESRPKRNIKLTYKGKMEKKTEKKAGPKKIKLITKKKTTKKMSPIIENDEDVFQSKLPKQHTENIETPKINSRETEYPLTLKNLDTPMKKKRKLYSPKDDEIGNERKGTKVSETEDDDIVLSELKTKNTKASTVVSTCYKEIERERQKHIRLPRTRKSCGLMIESPSVRTSKIDDMFDKLKTTVESNEKIILASKTAQADIYNFTSDSEDEDFVKKPFEKRISSTIVGSFESKISTRKGRQRNRPICAEKSSYESKNTKPVRIKKATKKSANAKIECSMDLVDERMRQAGLDDLESSIVVDKSKSTKRAEVELTLHEPPQMEVICDEQKTKVPKKKIGNKKKSQNDITSVKKEKHLEIDKLCLIMDKEDDKTVSPLPGLVVETIPVRRDDADDSFTTTMLQKLKRIYTEGPDAINESFHTQNMTFPDNERCSTQYSPQNVPVSGTDDACSVNYIKERICTESVTKKNKNNKHIKNTYLQKKLNNRNNEINTKKPSFSNDINEDVEIFEVTEIKSNTSITTDGITAHGYLDEAPPSPELITKIMQPREIVDLDPSVKDYFLKLNREMHESSSENSERAEFRKIVNSVLENSLSIKTPVVSVTKLSFDDINKCTNRTYKTDNYTKSSSSVTKIAKSVTLSKERTSNLKFTQKETSENVKALKNFDKIKVTKTPKIDPTILKSPSVSIVAMSQEELDKFLPMPTFLKNTNTRERVKEDKESSFKLVNDTRQESKTRRNKRSSRLAATVKNKSKNIDKTTSTSKQYADVIKDRLPTTSKNLTEYTSISNKTIGKIVTNATNSDSNDIKPKDVLPSYCKKKSHGNISLISPIKIFEGFGTNDKNQSNSDDDQSLAKIKYKFSKEQVKSKVTDKNTRSKKNLQDVASPDSTSSKNMIIESQNSLKTKVSDKQASTNVQEVEQLDSTSSNTQDIVLIDLTSTYVDESFKSPTKRKSCTVLGEPKMRRKKTNLESMNIDTAPSGTSVNEWLRNMESSGSRAIDANLSYKESLQHVLEKLNTTCDEINHNTSTMLVNLSMTVQYKLIALEEERHKMYHSAARDIITQMIAIIDAKFMNLEKRSQEMDAELKEYIKKQSLDLVHKDCDQRRAMVLILKEDVKACLDHVERANRKSP